MKGNAKAHLDAAKERIAALEDPSDPSDTAAVEVQLDALATALIDLRPRKSQKKVPQPNEELSDVLERYIEDGLIEPIAITIYDEIDSVIRLKDYEGYTDEYVRKRLGALLSDLANELTPAIEKLQAEANQ